MSRSLSPLQYLRRSSHGPVIPRPDCCALGKYVRQVHPALTADLFRGVRVRPADRRDRRRAGRVPAIPRRRESELPPIASAALVAAGSLTGVHRHDQALRERQIFMGDIGLRGIFEHPGPLASMLPATSRSHRPGYARNQIGRSLARYTALGFDGAVPARRPMMCTGAAGRVRYLRQSGPPSTSRGARPARSQFQAIDAGNRD